MDFLNTFVLTAKGANNAHAPHTTIKLKILEPIALLIANVLLLFIEAVTLTAHSVMEHPLLQEN